MHSVSMNEARAANPQMVSAPVMDEASFATLAKLVKGQTGIVLSDRKRDLVQGRLARRLRALGLPDYGAYCALLQSPEGERELGPMINAMTTNVTRFFREPHHFDMLRGEVIPACLEAGGTRFRLWSAGCSTGEEPYSIAMTLAAASRGASWDARILATDIDSDVLARAAAGRYEAQAADAIPAEYRRRYVGRVDDEQIEIHPDLRPMLTFKQLNLMHGWPMRGPFDAIFCRNVVIYFDKETQCDIFGRFADLLSPGGWLFIGHSETLHGVSHRFAVAGRTAYRKRG